MRPKPVQLVRGDLICGVGDLRQSVGESVGKVGRWVAKSVRRWGSERGVGHRRDAVLLFEVIDAIDEADKRRLG